MGRRFIEEMKESMTKQLIKNTLAEVLFGYRVCESIQDIRIVNFFYDNLLLEKLLYGEPISVPELRKLLRKKIVNFEFIKLDGEVRPAQGTTMMKYIPPKDHPKGIRPSSPKVATFFDLDKDAWRSVSKRSKEIVLKKDEETDKPIVVVRDKARVKVQPIPKERESKDPIEQGDTYKYKTNRGTNTHVEVLRELPNGLYQVSSPVFKTTFAIDPARIGDKFTPEEKEEEVEVKDVEPREKEPKIEEPLRRTMEKPEEEPKKKPKVTPVPLKKEPPTEIILPQEVKPEEKEETKAPPADITPPPSEEEEGPEELEK